MYSSDSTGFTSTQLKQFAEHHQLTDFCEATVSALHQGDYELKKVDPFKHFQHRIQQELFTHPIIVQNDYCDWFQQGMATPLQVKDFLVQFSVFSNQFLLAQLHKMLNAESLEEMRVSKEILANEIGVIFNGERAASDNKDMEGDPDFVSLDGSVDGGVFRFRAAHFEWLLKMGEHLGLSFAEMGKRKHAWPSTLFFCNELIRIYGNDNYQTATAASYAVENWAAAGFWDRLVEGFVKFKRQQGLPSMPLAFFTWHSKIEANHAHHTQEELEEYYFTHDVDEQRFIEKGREMLDGVEAFWNGLNHRRKATH